MKQKAFVVYLILLLVAFQNCSRVDFTSLSSLNDTIRSNNGTGYSGKPSGDFYRFHPEFTCESKAAAVSELHVVDNSAVFIENRHLQCGAVKQTMDPASIDKSTYQHDVVGFNEGIFESEASTPNSIPANLVEVWCQTPKGPADAPPIETVTHFNRETSSADTDLYYPAANGPIKNTFAVARVAAAQKVTVRGPDGFVLEVFRDQPAAQFGLFKGMMTAKLGQETVTIATACRLGGSLDAKIWPAKEIVDSPVTQFKVAADLKFFGFTSSLSEEPKRLFSADTSGQNLKIISPPMLKNGVQNFEIAPDLSQLLYWGDPRYTGGNELFRVDKAGTATAQLNELLTNSQQGQATDVKFSPDGTRVFYEDGHQETGEEGGTDIEMWLRAVPLAGGAPLVVNPPLPLVGDVGVYDFAISPSQNKVAYLAGNTAADLYIANLDGGGRIKPFANTTFAWYASLEVPGRGDYVFIDAFQSAAGGRIDQQTFAVAFDGSGVTALPLNSKLKVIHPDGKSALISADGKAFQRIDLKTSSLTGLAVLDKPFYSADGQKIYAGRARPDGLWGPTAVTISAAGAPSFQDLCASLGADQWVLQEVPGGDLVLAAYHRETSVLELYQRSATGECVRRNSLPLDAVAKADFTLMVSPDRQNILVRAGQRLYFVPLNGRPPLAVTSPVFATASVDEFHFLADSRSVLYFGSQLAPGVKNVFLWKAP